MNCSCCMVFDTNIYEGNAILTGVNSINLDVNFNFDWWDETDPECNPIAKRMDLIGPTIGSINITAHPFDNTSNDPHAFTLGFTCPFEVSVTLGYKWIYACNECSDCIDPLTGEVVGRKLGKWYAVPNKKKEIKVTGDITGIPTTLMEFGDKLYRVNKLNIQAGAAPFIVPSPTYLYSSFKYKGLPLMVDTLNDYIYEPLIRAGQVCQGKYGLPLIDAYLTSFQFKFEPPAPPTVQYVFQYYIWFCNI